jgi:hypothetical protein
MVLLNFASGAPFATGATPYNSFTAGEAYSRIILQVEIQAQRTVRTRAIVDTAAPYMICRRDIASYLGLEHDSSGEVDTVNIRGMTVEGSLHRTYVSFLAEEGDDVTIETTVFVPQIFELPHSFLGLTSCLESIYFAIDPLNEVFYFGPQS